MQQSCTATHVPAHPITQHRGAGSTGLAGGAADGQRPARGPSLPLQLLVQTSPSHGSSELYTSGLSVGRKVL